jgi:hypothetical protein
VAWRYLDLADFLLIAEAVLDIPAEDLAHAGRLELAESALHAPAASFGGVAFYPDLARKSAVLAARLINNHPLPDGNKRVGYLWGGHPPTSAAGIAPRATRQPGPRCDRPMKRVRGRCSRPSGHNGPCRR